MKKTIIILIICLVLLSSTVFAINYRLTNNFQNTITSCESDYVGGYSYFKQDFIPKPINGLKEKVNVALITGVNYKDLRCD